MLQRLAKNWVYGGSLAGLLLLLLSPVLLRGRSIVEIGAFLLLPAYMLHQLEEYDDDRFRAYFNGSIGKGREVLTSMAVFVINVPVVWGVLGGSLALAVFLRPAYALFGCYLLLVNAVVHVAGAIAQRHYNPGLITGVVLFLPLSLYELQKIRVAGDGGLAMELSAAGLAVAIHAAIMAYARARMKQSGRADQQSTSANSSATI